MNVRHGFHLAMDCSGFATNVRRSGRRLVSGSGGVKGAALDAKTDITIVERRDV